MKILYSVILAMTFFSTHVLSENTFQNYKESQSYYIGKKTRKKLSKFLYKTDKAVLITAFNNTFNSISDTKNLCSVTLVSNLKNEVNQLGEIDFDKNKTLILTFGREQNIYDDVVYKKLLKSYEIYSDIKYDVDYLNLEHLNYNEEQDKSKDQNVKQWRKNLNSKKCIIDSSLNLFHQFSLNIKWKNKNKKVKKKLKSLYKEGDLSYNEYKILVKLSKQNLIETWKTLDQYHKLLKSVNRIYPQAIQEPSDFVTRRSSWKKWSLREKLLKSYDIYQIGYLSDVIKRLKMRMNIEYINIALSNESGEIKENILLTPMEQYRFAVKMLRKEMAGLKLLSRFAGKNPLYGDLITAAFETGVIAAREIEFIVNLEYLWNPKMSKREKVLKYIEQYGGIAQIMIPPPYNAIFPIFLTILEYLTYEVKPDGAADVINLF